MAVLNTYDDISSFVNTVWADAMFAARENNVMTALVTNFADRTGMALRKNASYNSPTIGQINEQDDLAGQAFTPSVAQTLTPYEYGAQFLLTDQRMESDIYSVRTDAAIELGRAMGTKVDSLLAGLFSSLTAGTTGGGGTNMSWSQFFAAETKLRAAYAPQPYICVLHPYQYHTLGTAIAPGVAMTNAPVLIDEIANRWFVGNVGGVSIYLDGNISSGATCYGGMFSREAMAFDVRRAPRLEPERDSSRRAWELNLSAVFAYGVWRPAYGVCMTSSGTTPTA